jgi:hypothetical protein
MLPIILSTYGDCHGLLAATTTSSMPIDFTRPWKSAP